jgi:hypothetical protein
VDGGGLAVDALRPVLRVVGVVYVIGALVLLRAIWEAAANRRLAMRMSALFPDIEQQAVDTHRSWWWFCGALLVLSAGISLAFASRWAPWAMAALIAQQMAYFFRQRMAAAGAQSRREALEAAPHRGVRSAFYASLGVGVFSAGLSAAGVLT